MTGMSSIWWDLRPYAFYPTIEFRVCDAATRVDEVLCLAALTQAICAKLLMLRDRNLGFRKYMPSLIQENKWRAVRGGMDAKLIDFGKQVEVPMRDLALELLEFVDDVLDPLGSRREAEHLLAIVRDGTSADRQLAVHRETGHLHAVVDAVAAETIAGVPEVILSLVEALVFDARNAGLAGSLLSSSLHVFVPGYGDRSITQLGLRAVALETRSGFMKGLFLACVAALAVFACGSARPEVMRDLRVDVAGVSLVPADPSLRESCVRAAVVGGFEVPCPQLIIDHHTPKGDLCPDQDRYPNAGGKDCLEDSAGGDANVPSRRDAFLYVQNDLIFPGALHLFVIGVKADSRLASLRTDCVGPETVEPGPDLDGISTVWIACTGGHGMNSDHLILRWERHEVIYAVSLHGHTDVNRAVEVAIARNIEYVGPTAAGH